MNNEITECSNCIMTAAVDPDLSFDENGRCNHCRDYFQKRKYYDALKADNHYDKQVEAIKRTRSGTYDCMLGISGGTDSSYVCYLLYKAGLNVLLVHCDNGWDTEVALANLEKITQKTGFDLYVREMDTAAFYQAQKSMIRARVVDIELLSDHVNLATMFEVADEKKIPWIVTGENINTEFVMPKRWVHNKNDLTQLVDINQKFEQADMSTFPKLGPIKKYFINRRLKTQYFTLLNLIDYDKFKAREALEQEFDWTDHGGKHYESYFTVFFQCYILPKHFGVDKRYAHLSNLICAGIITKEEAKEQMAQPIIDEDKIQHIKEMVLKKFNWTASEFDAIMETPIASHADFATHWIYNKGIQRLINRFR